MSQKKILIVEDEVIVAKDLQMRLQAKGFDVPKIVNCGADVLTFLEENTVDLILMDIHLKGSMDGVQTAMKVQENWFVPIIYLTAFSDIETIQEAVRSEPFGYIVKPYDEQTLFIQIDVALYKAQIDEKIRNQEKWYHSILVGLTESIITTDMNGHINFINPAGRMLLDTTETLMGDHFGQHIEFMDDDGRPFSVHPIEKTIEKRCCYIFRNGDDQ